MITAVPPGEAPEWVRQKWVGLSLPLAQECEHAHEHETSGVLSRPRNLLSRLLARLFGRLSRENGYIVESCSAIEILAQRCPEAAKWWRENTPDLMEPGQYFLFHESSGHVQSLDAP